MMFTTFLFYAFATVLLASAVGVITVRNPVYAALYLILAFVTSAVLWLLLEAEFLAVVLVLVYVGAVMVLFLFVVMMMDINTATLREGFLRYAPVGAIVAGIIVLELAYVIWFRSDGLPVDLQLVPRDALYSSTEQLGQVLYTQYLYPFELAAMLLLLAIVAAILLTMRHRPGLKVQDVSEQVNVRREDRVRLVKMKSEPE
ncbi:MAG: NADH-quinone oxidoreductase subunit J [Gammaproteobacteria bacterium]|nr:NADH-quinone oxidoreductase subunit J [Gammaproteobacteria bacterium]MDH5275301.1 NADH-quinone oxidoreductase subunit J [Gammaproteobacteria bacterium]